jgi:uncharacterized membrane protein YphA (DoxX/SURF4 family)
MMFDTAGGGVAFLLGRLLFGLVMAFTGLNHFMNADQMTGYAGAKGVPAPGLAVSFTGGMLVSGGLGIALGAFPLLSAGAIAVFLLVTTPVMHDFWAVSGEEQQSEMTQFLKNTALLGVALVFLTLSTTPWPYALGVGV